jgi:hypothetical protein
MIKKESSQTAYQFNAHSSASTTTSIDHGWADPINRMLDQRYAFLALQYEGGGYLYRGMSAGLFGTLLNGKIWHYSDSDKATQFEKDLDVILFSQDFSDALTVSKLWEQLADACIIIFRSEIFNQALAAKKAAMLATAEPGVVFKYPFLTYPLNITDIDCLIVSIEFLNVINNREELNKYENFDDDQYTRLLKTINTLQESNKIIIPEAKPESHQRSLLEKKLLNLLIKREIVGATIIDSSDKPKRRAS